MRYEDINKLFIEEFPEFKRSYTNFFIDNEVREDEFQYIFYEGLVERILHILLTMKENWKRTDLLRKLFTFIEQMVCSNNDEIINLAHIAFFEYRDDLWYIKSWNFMSLNLINMTRGDDFDYNFCDDNVDVCDSEEIIDLFGIRIDLYNIFKGLGIKNDEIPGITSIEAYKQYDTLADAKKDSNTVMLLGRFGTSIPYIICPVAKINCDEKTLERLSEYLVKKDRKIKDANKVITRYYFSMPKGERIWNMNSNIYKHSRYNFEVWVNTSFNRKKSKILNLLS